MGGKYWKLGLESVVPKVPVEVKRSFWTSVCLYASTRDRVHCHCALVFLLSWIQEPAPLMCIHAMQHARLSMRKQWSWLKICKWLHRMGTFLFLWRYCFLLSVCYFSSQRSFGWGICCIQSLSQVTCSVATQNQTSWQLWGQFCRVKGFVEEPPPGIVGISNVKTNMPCSKHKSQGSTISSDHVVLESRSKRKVFKWVGFLQAGFHEAWASRGSWGSTTIWNNLA